MMKISFDRFNVSMPSLLSPKDKSEANAAKSAPPTDQASLQQSRAAFYKQNSGSSTRFQLFSMFRNRSNSAPAAAAAPMDPTALLASVVKDGITGGSYKFNRDKENIKQAAQEWTAGRSTLEGALNPFNKARKQVQGQPANDGMRSGVTAMLGGIIKPESGALPELREEAIALKETPIFRLRTHDGSIQNFTIADFGTPGEHGTGKIDELNLSPTERQIVMHRFSAALDDMQKLSAAYQSGAPHPPGRSFIHEDHFTVDQPKPVMSGANLRRASHVRHQSAPARLQTVRETPDMDSLFAKANKYLNPNELRMAATGQLDIMSPAVRQLLDYRERLAARGS